jgi:hypothetical protein
MPNPVSDDFIKSFLATYSHRTVGKGSHRLHKHHLRAVYPFIILNYPAIPDMLSGSL